MASTCNRWLMCFFCVLTVLLLLCARAPAQTITGEISGVVLDSSGAVVPQAAISLADGTLIHSDRAGEREGGSLSSPRSHRGLTRLRWKRPDSRLSNAPESNSPQGSAFL